MEVPRQDFSAELRGRLEVLRREDRLRALAPPAGIDFSSNDYLGMSTHPDFRRRLAEAIAGDERTPLFAPSSRLLRGHTRLHDAFEERLARYKGTESALLFPSGYQANVALLSSLIRPGDLVVSDELNHASLIDGIRASRAECTVFSHRDIAAVERALCARRGAGRTFLVTESLFSMDGDEAPLGAYAELAARHGAELIVDDAHATGVFGETRGSGLTEEHGIEGRCAAIVSTFGKALGCAGAMVCGPRLLRDYLINHARPFIFSTAVPPLLLHAVGVALDIAAAEPWRRRSVLERAARLRARIAGAGLGDGTERGPIVPVVLGTNARALAVAAALRERGFDVRAVRPPAVPAGAARLRLSVHAGHDLATIDALADALADVAARSVA